jgi:hypothetical protein
MEEKQMEKQMEKQKSKFPAVKLARAAVGVLSVVLLNPVASAQSTADNAMAPLMGSIFANTYVSTGAGAVINGDVLAGTYLTTGADAVNNGGTVAATVTTLGASASVTGDLQSGTATVFGAGAVAGSSTLSPVTSISGVRADVQNAQSVLNGLTTTTVLAPGNIATDITFTPGVYKVTGLKSVTAGVTITLDAGGVDDPEFIFNISNYLTFGADVNVVVINGGANARVIWNATGGYITIGAGADIVGTVMAHTYVSTGAFSVLSGPLNTCGGAVYSATSYVSVGAGATVGAGHGCTSVGPPESECDSCEVALVDYGGVKITWCPVEGAVEYWIHRWSEDIGEFERIGLTTGGQHCFTDYDYYSFPTGVVHHYRVVACIVACETSIMRPGS